ncbi:MAG: endopeptidase La, partial [Erysipelothrix sp.]|nr:endopeptidase La [Erysipelothrix sp.]
MQEESKRMNIPVVATRGIVLFPNQEILIEVGRPKSINAIEEAEKFFNGHVVLVSQKDVLVDDPLVDELYEVGTLVHIKSVKQKQGFLRVTFSGLQRAKIDTLNEDSQMLFASVTLLEDEMGDKDEEEALIRSINREIKNAMSFDRASRAGGQSVNIPREFWDNFLLQSMAPTKLADQFAQHFPLPLESKQTLLETLNVNTRIEIILSEIQREKTLSDIESDINERVKGRVEENQREYYLREKMRAIREELGDV